MYSLPLVRAGKLRFVKKFNPEFAFFDDLIHPFSNFYFLINDIVNILQS